MSYEDIKKQENWVNQQYNNIPQDQRGNYNKEQISYVLRQEYYGNRTYDNRDHGVLSQHWNTMQKYVDKK